MNLPLFAQTRENKMVINDETSLRRVMKKAWEDYAANEKKNGARISEITPLSVKNGRNICSMTYGNAVMRYSAEIIGEPDENGYPLYICLHGGGAGDTPDINNSQWEHMMIYYRRAIRSGICAAPRGVRDTYDCHSNPESYALYDELIENMILFENADPNRVYLLGFSAGGDGVYQVSVKMADRFAAVNMSAGHPNGLSIENLCSLPIVLQCGENDAAYNRNIVTAEYGIKLDRLQEKAGCGHYIHSVFVHSGKPHNFVDYGSDNQSVLKDYTAVSGGSTETVMSDTNAVNLVSKYTRNALPDKIEWNLGTRAEMRNTDSFYWLSADKSMDSGMIHAGYNKSENSITLYPEGTEGDFDVLINPDMVDMFRPIAFFTPQGKKVITVNPDFETIVQTTAERGDPYYQFAARVSYRSILSGITV